ncbi:MAG: hypothetical protein KY456_04655 [Chloroflexi bacterium]|nr:hypothetical protein [Chloroflexota bacterium]
MHTFVRTLARGTAASIGVAALSFGLAGPSATHAQDETVDVLLRGYPLAIHQGTCETLVAEPSYQLASLWPRPLLAAGGEDDGAYTADDFYADGGTDALGEDTGFLFDDVDDDGVTDYGLDLDRDNVLAENEVLDRPILWASENTLNDLEGAVAGEEGAELADLRDVPHALVVHATDISDTQYLSCAEIEGFTDDEGQLVAVMKPMGNNGFTGIAEFEQSDTGFLGIGGDGGAADVYAWPAQVTQSGSGSAGAGT